MIEIQMEISEINVGPDSSIWLSLLLLIDEGYVSNKQAPTHMIKIS